MSIRRVVPDISSERVEESREFYTGVLGFELGVIINVMRHILTAARE